MLKNLVKFERDHPKEREGTSDRWDRLKSAIFDQYLAISQKDRDIVTIED